MPFLESLKQRIRHLKGETVALYLAECRARAQVSMAEGARDGRIAAAIIIGIWLLLAALCALWAYEALAVGNPSRPAGAL